MADGGCKISNLDRFDSIPIRNRATVQSAQKEYLQHSILAMGNFMGISVSGGARSPIHVRNWPLNLLKQSRVPGRILSRNPTIQP